jgi:replicative DNA helicase
MAMFNERMERAVLACCLIDGRRAVEECFDKKVSAQSFYIPTHCDIFRACLSLYEAKKEINSLTVGEHLREHGNLGRIGGYECLNDITDEIEVTTGLFEYIQSLKKYELFRSFQRIFTKANEAIEQQDTEPFEIAMGVTKEIKELINEHAVSDNYLISEVVQNAAIELSNTSDPKNKPIMTGFKKLDGTMGGLRRGEFVIIAARPSVGKTAFALNIAENIAKNQSQPHVLFFSMEMTAVQLGKRMLRDHFLDGWNGLFGCFANRELAEAQTLRYVDALKNCPIRIDETGRLTLSELYRRVSIETKKGNADIVIIDYLQLLRTTEKFTRYEQVTEISFQLKAMAKEFNITLVALSQLNRASCKDPSKPSLHDLRESGAIEQDADVVLLLGRPDEEGKEAERHVYVAKNRNGNTGYVQMTFDGNRTRFYEV